MQNKEPITLDEKKRLYAFFKSEDGKVFIDLIKDMQASHLDLAQGMYLKVLQPNEQVCTQVSMAGGVKEVLDFIEQVEVEVKEAKKEEEENQEL